MSAVAEPVTIDLDRFPKPPFARLVAVELRKMYDTRAGLWLLISTGLLTAAVMVIQLLVIVTQDLTVGYHGFLIAMNTPMGIMLPVLGVMSVTSEWGQRTAMVTFTQTPSRSRVIGAKLASVALLAVVAVVLGLALAAVGNLLYGGLTGNPVSWEVGGGAQIFYFFLLHLLGLVTGFALGMLLLNTPAAIVIYFVYSFVLPTIFGIAYELIGWFHDLRPWVDFAFAQQPLVEGGVSGDEWAHLVVSGLFWLALPFVVGLWRVLRAEVK
jgi:ABC-type transport system involved in multi-copper enzyme maturation permease subunit